MDEWKYVGTRFPLQSPQGHRIEMHVISVPHPNGDWEAIYCNTKEQAEEIINNRTQLAALEREMAVAKGRERLLREILHKFIHKYESGEKWESSELAELIDESQGALAALEEKP